MDYQKDFYEGYANTSAGRLHYLHHSGSGRSIVFLHGLGASARVWQKLMTFLPDSMDVYLLDLLGHGDSDKPHIKYNVNLQVGVLNEFISSLPAKPYLFGNSYGGWIAARYASGKDALPGIMLEDPAGLKQYFLDSKAAIGIDRYRERMLKNLLAINGNERYVMESILDEDADESLWLDGTELSRISCRCLIIWGSADHVIEARYANALKEGIRGSRLNIIDGAGHDAHYTNPDTVAKLIIDFVK